MDLDQLKQILGLVREHDVSEIEIEQEGLRLRIRKDLAPVVVAQHVTPVAHHVAAATPVAPAAAMPPAAVAPAAADSAEMELAVLKSPIVGTFYRSAEPGAPPFVEIGTMVKKGQVLCIIEAMKLMNEIDSEYDGEVVKVYVENGQAVQYGERLFAIKTT